MRTQRAFMVALGERAGHTLRFDVVSLERMFQTSVAAHEQGYVSGFQRMIREITDPQRVSALREAQSFLDQHRGAVDWRDHYMATTEGERTYTLTLVGRSSDLPNPPPLNGETLTITTATRQTDEQSQAQRSS